MNYKCKIEVNGPSGRFVCFGEGATREDAKADAQRQFDAWLTSREKPQEPTGWQPIETAPKDGSRILLLCDCKVGVKIVEGWWASFMTRDEPWWMTWEGQKHTRSTELLSPTHWMLKPFPPTI